MKIIEIKKLKRRYAIKFDEELNSVFEHREPSLSDKIYVTEDTIVKFRLAKGTDYTSEQIKEIFDFANYSYGKNLAIYFISFKFRSSAEVSKYLLEHEILALYIPQILRELGELGLINDEKYSESYISAKLLSKTSGPYAIKQKLLQKGLAEALINQQLAELFGEDKQLEVASQLARKLARIKASQLPLKQLKLKLSQGLVNKGFSYGIAEQALAQLELEADEENEQDLLAKETEKAYRRLSRRYEGYDLKQRLSQTLARKGFDWSAISDALVDYDF